MLNEIRELYHLVEFINADIPVFKIFVLKLFRFGKSSKKSHKEATVSAAKEFNKVNSEPAHFKSTLDQQ